MKRESNGFRDMYYDVGDRHCLEAYMDDTKPVHPLARLVDTMSRALLHSGSYVDEIPT